MLTGEETEVQQFPTRAKQPDSDRNEKWDINPGNFNSRTSHGHRQLFLQTWKENVFKITECYTKLPAGILKPSHPIHGLSLWQPPLNLPKPMTQRALHRSSDTWNSESSLSDYNLLSFCFFLFLQTHCVGVLSIRAAITKCHRRWLLKDRKVFLTVLEVRKSRIKAPA